MLRSTPYSMGVLASDLWHSGGPKKESRQKENVERSGIRTHAGKAHEKTGLQSKIKLESHAITAT